MYSYLRDTTIEGYYQETGRAGRDGDPAHCLLFFSRGDIPKLRFFIDRIEDGKERAIALEQLNQVVKFASHNVCRRKQLLAYFGEEYPAGNCGACDICSGDTERIDVTIDAQIVMSAIARTQERFGIGYIIDVVTGVSTKRIMGFQHDKIKTFGVGKDRDKYHWRHIIDELIAQGLVRHEGDPYPLLKLAESAHDILQGKKRIAALKRVAPKGTARRGTKDEPSDASLFGKLRALRKTIADEGKVPPYVVFSDKTLHEMCRHYPTTPSQMINVSGVGETKLKQYGNQFIAEINRHLGENPEINPSTANQSGLFEHAGKKKKVGDSVEETYALFKKGLSPDEIAKQRTLAPSTIMSHIETLVQTGRDIDINKLIAPGKRHMIEGLFQTLQHVALGFIVERGEGQITFHEARLVRAYMSRKKD